ncbi:hypothetical protein C8R46DRAFT_239946 [Mycena filopes]|nr:hypothetical protein C8R46DRAFT_239946 [Mycena filopes]
MMCRARSARTSRPRSFCPSRSTGGACPASHSCSFDIPRRGRGGVSRTLTRLRTKPPATTRSRRTGGSTLPCVAAPRPQARWRSPLRSRGPHRHPQIRRRPRALQPTQQDCHLRRDHPRFAALAAVLCTDAARAQRVSRCHSATGRHHCGLSMGSGPLAELREGRDGVLVRQSGFVFVLWLCCQFSPARLCSFPHPSVPSVLALEEHPDVVRCSGLRALFVTYTLST